jgi:hypothetical protein
MLPRRISKNPDASQLEYSRIENGPEGNLWACRAVKRSPANLRENRASALWEALAREPSRTASKMRLRLASFLKEKPGGGTPDFSLLIEVASLARGDCEPDSPR